MPKSDDGPAFPEPETTKRGPEFSKKLHRGMSFRAFVASTPYVPDSGFDRLNEIIQKARRKRFTAPVWIENCRAGEHGGARIIIEDEYAKGQKEKEMSDQELPQRFLALEDRVETLENQLNTLGRQLNDVLKGLINQGELLREGIEHAPS